MKTKSLRVIVSAALGLCLCTPGVPGSAFALAPPSTFRERPISAKSSETFVGEEDLTQDERQFIRTTLESNRTRTKFYPWNEEIMLRICQLGKVPGIPKSRDSDPTLRTKLYRLVDKIRSDPRTFIDAADRDMLGEKLPQAVALILARTVESLSAIRSDKSAFQAERIKEMEALHYTLIDLLTTGQGVVRTDRLIDGESLQGRPVKIELRIVQMEGDGFPKAKNAPEQSDRPVRDAVTYDRRTNTVRIHLTSGFVNDTGISQFSQALLLPLMEIFSGKTRHEAMQELGRYNEEVKPGVAIPVSDLLLQDIVRAGIEGKWTYLQKLLQRYRTPAGMSEEDSLASYYRKIQDKITWSFIDNPAAGGGQKTLEETFVRLRDQSLIQRYQKADPKNPMNEQHEAAARAFRRLEKEASANLNAWSHAGMLDIRKGSGQRALREWIRKFWDASGRIHENYYPIPGYVHRLKMNAVNPEMIGRAEFKLLVDPSKPAGYLRTERTPLLSAEPESIRVQIGTGSGGLISKEDLARLMILLWSEIGDLQGRYALDGSMHKDGGDDHAYKPMFDTPYVQYVLGELVRIDGSLAETPQTGLPLEAEPPARKGPHEVDIGFILPLSQRAAVSAPKDEGRMDAEMAKKMRETGKKAKQYAAAHWSEDTLEDPDEAIWIFYGARDRNLLHSILADLPEPLPKAGKGLRAAAAVALDLIERRVLKLKLEQQFQLEPARILLENFTRKVHHVLGGWMLMDAKALPGMRAKFLEKLEDIMIQYPPRVDVEPFVRGSNMRVEVRENSLKLTACISQEGAAWNKEDWIRLIVASYYFRAGGSPAPKKFFENISRSQESVLKDLLDLERKDLVYQTILWDILRQFHQTEVTDPLGAENPFFDRDKLINSAPADTDPDFVPELRKFLRVAHLLEIAELEEYLKKIRSRPNFYAVIASDQFRLDIAMTEIHGRYVEIGETIQKLLRDPHCALQKVASLLHGTEIPMFTSGPMFEKARENPTVGIPKLLESIQKALPEYRKKEEDALRTRTLMSLWGRVSGDPFVFEGGRMIPVPDVRDEDLMKHYLSLATESSLEDPHIAWENVRRWIPEPFATHMGNCRLLIWKDAPYLALIREEGEAYNTVVVTQGLWTLLAGDLSSLGFVITEQFGREQDKLWLDSLNGPYTRADVVLFRSLKNALNDQAWNEMNMEKARAELAVLTATHDREMRKENSLPASERGLSSILHDAKSNMDLLALRTRQAEDNKGVLRRAVEEKMQSWEGKTVDDIAVRLHKLASASSNFKEDLIAALHQRGASAIPEHLSLRLNAARQRHLAVREKLSRAKRSVWVSLEALVHLKHVLGSFVPMAELLLGVEKLSGDVPVFITSQGGEFEAREKLPELFEKCPSVAENIIPGVKTGRDFQECLSWLPQDRSKEDTVVFDHRSLHHGKVSGARKISQENFNLPRLAMELRLQKLLKDGAFSLSRTERRDLDTHFAHLFSADLNTRKASLAFLLGLKLLRRPDRNALRDAILDTLIASPLEEELAAVLLDQMRRKHLTSRYHNWIVYKLITTNSPGMLQAVLNALADSNHKVSGNVAADAQQLLTELESLSSQESLKVMKEPALREMIHVAVKAIPRYWDDSIASGLGEVALDNKNLLTGLQRLSIINLLAKQGKLELSTGPTKTMLALVLETAVLDPDIQTHYRARDLLSHLMHTLGCGEYLMASVSEAQFRSWQAKVPMSRLLEIFSFLMKEAGRPRSPDASGQQGREVDTLKHAETGA